MSKQSQIKALISAIMKNGVDGLIDSVTSLYKDEVRMRLHYTDFNARTDRARNPLISFDEAIYYSSTFTQEHLDRFNYALNNLGTQMMFADKIAVIDYGCGQGLATLAFLNYLKNNNCIANKLVDIHLIEPSVVTLGLARQFILAMAKYCQISVNISIHQQSLADYLNNPIKRKSSYVNLHLLSNVVDVPAIQNDLLALSRHINTQAGKQIICAVSPYNAGFELLCQGLYGFYIQNETFSIDSYRFNSNRCVWQNKPACGKALFAQKLA